METSPSPIPIGVCWVPFTSVAREGVAHTLALQALSFKCSGVRLETSPWWGSLQEARLQIKTSMATAVCSPCSRVEPSKS